MVAATTEMPKNPPGSARDPKERVSQSVSEVLKSANRIVSIQARLLALHTKLTIQRIVIFLILAAAAAAVGILGLIFLDIGLFYLFTMVMAPHWAYLLHAALHLVIATALFIWARNQFNSPNAFLSKSNEEAKPSDTQH